MGLDKGRGLYEARKMWHQLCRDGVTGRTGRPVARCTVERLMRELGLRVARRGVPVITTRPDGQAGRAPDLVDRDFTAARPNQLWVVDMTYVPTWSGTGVHRIGVRCVLAADRRVALRGPDAHRAPARRPGDGPVDPGTRRPDH